MISAMTTHRFEWSVRSLLEEIASAAFVEADVMAESYSAHQLHQLADLCEQDNLPTTLRQLGLAFTEVLAFLRALNPVPFREADGCGSSPDVFSDFGMTTAAATPLPQWLVARIKELVTEWLICRVLAYWTAIVIPGREKNWLARCDTAKSAVTAAAGSARSFGGICRRRVPPI